MAGLSDIYRWETGWESGKCTLRSQKKNYRSKSVKVGNLSKQEVGQLDQAEDPCGQGF